MNKLKINKLDLKLKINSGKLKSYEGSKQVATEVYNLLNGFNKEGYYRMEGRCMGSVCLNGTKYTKINSFSDIENKVLVNLQTYTIKFYVGERYIRIGCIHPQSDQWAEYYLLYPTSEEIYQNNLKQNEQSKK